MNLPKPSRPRACARCRSGMLATDTRGGDRIASSPAQSLVVLGPYSQILLLQPPLVGDRLLLHIFDIERPAEAVVLIEDTRRPFAAQHAAQQRGQFHGVVNPEVETQPAERVVHVGAVAREKDAALAE